MLIIVCQVECILSFLNYAVIAEEMLSSYTSMRALDKFGNSVQLKHAREAATRHGRLVVAAKRVSETVESGGVVVVSVGNQKVVRSLTLPLLTNNQGRMVAICCTGVKSDADWLIRHLQAYTASVWEHYDHHPIGISSISYWLSRILGTYQDDDLEDEWQSSIRRSSEKKSTQDNLKSALSRPLGVQTLLLSIGNSKTEPCLLMVEPTGRIFKAETTNSFSFATMGKQSDVLSERLSRSTMEKTLDLEPLLVQEILQTLGPARNEVVELVVEVIRPESGIECMLLVYKNGKELSRSVLPLL